MNSYPLTGPSVIVIQHGLVFNHLLTLFTLSENNKIDLGQELFKFPIAYSLPCKLAKMHKYWRRQYWNIAMYYKSY